MSKRGDTWFFDRNIYVRAYASCVGKKENEGPLRGAFDLYSDDNRFGEKTWEKAESRMVELACQKALFKSKLRSEDIGCFLGGDLLNQCISTSFACRSLGWQTLGLYGACSTMAEGLMLGSALVEAGLEQNPICCASSHFCSAERQYRFPLEYGSQRPRTSQWTATAAGAVILDPDEGRVRVRAATAGRVFDPGVKDTNNMGAAMAQAAYETISSYFRDSGSTPCDYDLIVTGDLSLVGKGVVERLFKKDGVDVSRNYNDCGLMLYYMNTQDVHAGASGCGCSASVLCARILPAIEKGELERVLFCGTGALLSPISAFQGESIPGVCHLVCLEAIK
ncbi:MAG: stage V sporulation protein AD [Clostridia bacterium]|nr:stage V sporulation protein AD [Clostridia bacterium]